MEVCGSGLLSLLINLVNSHQKKSPLKKSLFENSILAQALYGSGDHRRSWVALINCMKKEYIKKVILASSGWYLSNKLMTAVCHHGHIAGLTHLRCHSYGHQYWLITEFTLLSLEI